MTTVCSKQKSPSPFQTALQETIPVIFGYVPLGMAFGLCFVKAGGSPLAAMLMSLFVFAGAAQFVAVTILTAQGSLLSLFMATFFINLRHIFYGISFVGKFPNNQILKKLYMIYGLTDEAYSILTTTDQPENQRFSFWVILISHFYWVVGTLIGAFAVEWIPYDLSFLQFSLTALFVVLAIEQADKIDFQLPLIISVMAALIAIIFFKPFMLLVSMGLVTVIMACLYKRGGYCE